MKAIVLQSGTLSFTESYSIPSPAPDEALIKVEYAGICRTDMELLSGYMAFSGIPGHEFVGHVAECRDRKLLGRRVTGEINLACGHCAMCIHGLFKHCPSRTTLGIDRKDGAFSEYLTLPVVNLHPVPTSVASTAAVFTEPLAAAIQVMDDHHFIPAEPVLVIGDGKLGILVALLLARTGFDVHLLGRHESKLNRVSAIDPSISCRQDLGTRRFQTVIEASGTAAGFRTAIDAVHPRGTIVLKSTFAAVENPPLFPVVVNEIRILGSRCGSFPPALRALERNLIDPRPLIDGIFPLDEWQEAFQAAGEKHTIKILFEM